MLLLIEQVLNHHAKWVNMPIRSGKARVETRRSDTTELAARWPDDTIIQRVLVAFFFFFVRLIVVRHKKRTGPMHVNGYLSVS